MTCCAGTARHKGHSHKVLMVEEEWKNLARDDFIKGMA
jgi:hypothetical protein